MSIINVCIIMLKVGHPHVNACSTSYELVIQLKYSIKIVIYQQCFALKSEVTCMITIRVLILKLQFILTVCLLKSHAS